MKGTTAYDGACACGGLIEQPPRRCVEQEGKRARWARGKVMLTVAHLDPTVQEDGYLDSGADNLRAMYQRCHLRIDSKLHRWNRSRSLERWQARLLPVPPKPTSPSQPKR